MTAMDDGSKVRALVWVAGGATLAFTVLTYVCQWAWARRHATQNEKVDERIARKVWSLRTLRNLFAGGATLFVATPIGYGLIDGIHGFSDCMAFTMPCLAGMVVGWGFLRAQYPVPERPAAKSDDNGTTPTPAEVDDSDRGVIEKKTTEKNITEQKAAEQGAVEHDAVEHEAVEQGAAEKEAVAENGAPLLELRYYIISVFVIALGYIFYLIAHPSRAIAVMVILSLGWFMAGWFFFIWRDRIRYSRSEDFPGFLVLLAIGILLGGLSIGVGKNWSALLPPACEHHEQKPCTLEADDGGKRECEATFEISRLQPSDEPTDVTCSLQVTLKP